MSKGIPLTSRVTKNQARSRRASKKGAKRGKKSTQAEKDTVYGTMSVDGAVWEFIQTCEEWKKTNGRSFIPQSSIFQIILSLGYRKSGSVYKICKNCQGFFTPHKGETASAWSRRTYCSSACGHVFSIPELERTKICLNCGERFEANGKKHHWNKKIYCSESCALMNLSTKLGWTEEDDKLIRSEYTVSGSNIPTLINKGWSRRQIIARAKVLNIPYIGISYMRTGKSFLSSNATKKCIGCGKVFYHSHRESPYCWQKRKYCTLKCANSHSIFTPEEQQLIREQYPFLGGELHIEGKTRSQIKGKAQRMGVRFIRTARKNEDRKNRLTFLKKVIN